MNRLASTGETADPCGVPRSLAWTVPSGATSGAASHRLTYSSTHRWSGVMFAATAETIRSHGTLSKNAATSTSMTHAIFRHRFWQGRHRIQRAAARPVPVGIVMEDPQGD